MEDRLLPHLCEASNGKFYVTLTSGGTSGVGILFEYNPTTDTYTKKIDFNNNLNQGMSPIGGLTEANNGKLYGVTQSGGTSGMGVLFEYDPATNTYIKKIDFDGTAKGRIPNGYLLQSSNGKIYGMTNGGGSSDEGVLFEYDPITNTYTKKVDFNGTGKGSNPYGSLIQANNGKLYGLTSSGGESGNGVLFEFDPITDTYINKLDFDGTAKGSNPFGSLIQANNGKLYGLANRGGAPGNDIFGYGILFEFDPITNTYTKKVDFNGTDKGNRPYGSLIQASNGKLYGRTRNGGISNLGILFQYDPINNVFNKKFDFDRLNGPNFQSGPLIEINNYTSPIDTSVTLVGMNATAQTSQKPHTCG